jgi:peptidoglycan hydrolase CwlO-like protein
MRRFFVLLGGAALAVAPFGALAQANPNSSDGSLAATQAALEAQLADIENQIAAQQSLLNAAQSAHQTLQTQIDALDAQIKKTQLQVQAINLTIEQLHGGISDDNQTLSDLSTQLSAEKESLAEILRQVEMLDDYSPVEVALSAGSVSQFFGDLDAFAAIQSSLAGSFDQIAKTSSSTADHEAALEDKLEEQEALAQEAQLAKQQVQAQEREKQQLLTATKGQEANYQNLIAENQQTAAQIRAALFNLAGGGGQIPLPTAITLAEAAGKLTGVDPAFILGILKQETNLGANVGQCLLTNSPNKGNGKGKNTSTFFARVMAPNRDVDPFEVITGSLGFDWHSMPVSCPQSTGYGGAMGPAQFIASTWQIYSARIAKLDGDPGGVANPWDNQDAFTAVALYMDDLGASAGTAAAQHTAALKYFAGGAWKNPAFAFYGDSVMSFTAEFRQQIDILNGS